MSTYKFGPWDINKDTIFYETPLTYCFTNLRPAYKGHVLVSPKRVCQHFDKLTEEERLDLLNTANMVSKAMQKGFKTEGCAVTLQDGPAAGQTVPHVHFHVIPRNFPTEWKPSPNLPDDVRKQQADLYRTFMENL